MIDYKLLAALAAVVEEAGFERAARRLRLSQSAVSQRIKLLEARLGQAVLVRASPPRPTPLGLRLLHHVQQVRLLETDLQAAVPGLGEDEGPQRLRVALNADSLATWWMPAVAPRLIADALLLDMVVEDQDVGLRRMRAGEVAACLCASPGPVAGARMLALGAMRYLAVAAPAFCERHFGAGTDAGAFARAPAIVFGPDDRLQHRYLAGLGLEGAFPHHFCPSAEGFLQTVVAGVGWGLLPELQCRDALERGMLRELSPGRPIDVPLYWHYWRSGGAALQALTDHLAASAGRWLLR
ncbi:LysR family transcriptional regulator ArgP [[Pseudomonas] boreopolis]|uniref:LysR family transcriptional regulator ArgP n=1 Tax=Xanthomonas boreopolis TaxID=86183 RepID=UPI003DA16FFB